MQKALLCAATAPQSGVKTDNRTSAVNSDEAKPHKIERHRPRDLKAVAYFCSQQRPAHASTRPIVGAGSVKSADKACKDSFLGDNHRAEICTKFIDIAVTLKPNTGEVTG